jgi:hypothetical protein
MLLRALLCLGVIVFALVSESLAQQVDVRLVTDEPEAVLAILAKKKANESITDADWKRVFTSEGYTRLQKREFSMQRPFEEAEFQKFVLSDDLSQRDVMCDQRLLLATYNEAAAKYNRDAKEPLALWSESAVKLK